MELDDLKQTWHDHTQQIKLNNTDIMNLIQHTSTGPVERLKRRFKKQLVILPFVVLLIINNLSRHHDIFSDVLFWLYICICIALLLHFYNNYNIVKKMQSMDGMVKSTLEKQVDALESGLKNRLLFTRLMAVVFLVLTEILMYFQKEPSFVRWYAQPLVLRLSCYALLLTGFYFFSKFVTTRKYGKHIGRLKELVSQL